MKKFILQYLVMSYALIYASDPLAIANAITNREQTSILAKWGLQYCLQYDKENLFKPNQYGFLREDVALGKLDLQKYFDDKSFFKEPMNTYRFDRCLSLYWSEEYRLKVYHIVKKYCEICE